MNKSWLIAVVLIGITAGTALAATGSDVTADAERLFLEGSYDAAARECERLIAVRSSPADELFYLKGLCDLKRGRYPDARKSFAAVGEGRTRSKRAFDASIGTGDAYLLEGKPADAITAYTAAERYATDDNSGVLYARLASAYRAAGQADQAASYARKAERALTGGFDATIPAGAPPVRQSAAPAASTAATVTDVRLLPGHISVQVGSFKEKDNADAFSAKLSREGYASYIETEERKNGTLYRVRVGKLATKAEANAVAKKLKAKGYSVQVCDGNVCR